jgi:hypothetical protein
LDGDKLISKKSFNNVRTIRNPVPTFQPLRSWRAAQLHRNSRSEKSSHSLSFKLHLNFQRYQGKYERLKLQTDEYLMQSDSAKDEIKMLNRLKDLLNDLTKKNSICEKFYANFDLIAARQILINSNASLQKYYTVALEGIIVYIEQFTMFVLSLIIDLTELRFHDNRLLLQRGRLRQRGSTLFLT